MSSAVTTLGVDIGGTFTDFALCDGERGTVTLMKVPSTPRNQADGVINGIEELGGSLRKMDRIVHGTTVGTNAILQRQGAKVGLITTKGFRDLIEIGRTQRLVPNSMFKPKFVRPKPLVPRHLRFEVGERVLATGEVLKSIDRKELDELAEIIAAEAVESIAIGFLHSYRTSKNEKEAGHYFRERLPGMPVSLSSELIAEYREFERFSSTVVNAYLVPVMTDYLETLESYLRKRGYKRRLFVMNSSGGMIDSKTACSFPLRTILSGPAGGVNGAIHAARQAGFMNIITYDMGGTSTDVCLVQNLVPIVSPEHHLSGIPIKTLQMEINTVGAGGGSIAWVDEDRRLKVGPKSAGAEPGPASYGRGGEHPTITDANLFVGRLGAKSILGGKIKLVPELAKASLERLSKKLDGLELHKLAEGIIQIAVTRMASSIKEISVEQGRDPRDYVLVPYGGAGPMHSAQIAQELGISRIVIPRSPGNLSALGLVVSDVRHDDVESWLTTLQALHVARLREKFQRMEDKAAALLCDEGFASEQILIQRALDLRYRGQAFELSIPVQMGDSLRRITQQFHSRFQERYGHSHPEQEVEVVNLRLSSFGVVEKPLLPPLASERASFARARKDERIVFFHGRFLETPIFDRELLPPDQGVDGPAIIEERGATTVIPPGWMVKVDSYGNLLMNRGNEEWDHLRLYLNRSR